MIPPLPPEIEQVVPALADAAPVTWAQLWSALGATFITTVGGLGAIWLKRKRPKAGAEDAVYEVNRATIEDQRAQIAALQKENDALRTSRNEFEAAATRAITNHQIAAEAAETARGALLRTQSDMSDLREKWERAQRYIYALRAELARHNIPLPPEPA